MGKGVDKERVQWIEIEVTMEDGTSKKAKGKVKIFYQGQPVHCKSCRKMSRED